MVKITNQRGFAHLLIIIILFLGIAGGVYLVLEGPKIFKSGASNSFSLSGFNLAFGAHKGDANYDPQYDANSDGVINVIDRQLLNSRFIASEGSQDDSAVTGEDFHIVVGEEEYVMGPKYNIPDTPFFATPISSGVRVFTSSGNAYSSTASNLESIDYDNLDNTNNILLKPSRQSGTFDECGLALQSVLKLDILHWTGWYHAEQNCPSGVDYVLIPHHKSMAFTESKDGGITWVKPAYPDNLVLVSDKSMVKDTQGNFIDSAGDGWVIKKGDFLYMFYTTGVPDDRLDPLLKYKVRVARSRLVDYGQPGSWSNYYHGDFTENSLGGKSSSVSKNLNESTVIYNSYLGRYMAPFISGKYGFYLNFSKGDDLLKWEGYPSNNAWNIYPQVSDNNDSNPDLPYYLYGSFLAGDGNSQEIGQEFYLYYMKLFGGTNDIKNRYLMRRKINFVKNEDQPVYDIKLALINYRNDGQRKTKSSTEIAPPSSGYKKTETLGYLLSHPAKGFRSLYECIISGKDYYLTVADPNSWQSCDVPNSKFVRTVGFISTDQTGQSTTALYACYNKSEDDHFSSTDPSCSGQIAGYRLGYIASSSNSLPISELNPKGDIKPGSSKISWNRVEGADHYNLSIDDQSNGYTFDCEHMNPGDVCQDLKESSYTYNFQNDHKYNIWVRSVDSSGNLSAPVYTFITVSEETQPSPSPISVPSSDELTINLTAEPNPIKPGKTSNLTWSTTNASSCYLITPQQPNAGDYGTKNTITVAPNQGDNIYKITCNGPSGSQTAQINIKVQ